jgi:hypothetical protein
MKAEARKENMQDGRDAKDGRISQCYILDPDQRILIT